MIVLLTLLILIALVLYGLKEYYQIKLGVTPMKTPQASLAYLANLIERSADSGTFLDLGSSYGTRVLTMARRLPTWEITGIEQSPTPWVLANIRTIGKNFGNYRFFLSDPMQWPLQDYSVIFIHQNEKTLKRWEASIATRLQPGTLLITYNRPFPRLRPLDTIAVTPQTTLYLYKRAPREPEEEPVLPIDTVVPAAPPVTPVIEQTPENQPPATIPL